MIESQPNPEPTTRAFAARLNRALQRAQGFNWRPLCRLIWPRPVIVGNSFLLDRLPKFGATVLVGVLFVDSRMIAAPHSIIDAIVAQAFGRVARGHTLATLCAIMSMLGLAVLPAGSIRTVEGALVIQFLGANILGGLCWLSRSARKFEADAFSASVVGGPAAEAALGWLSVWTGRGWTPAMIARRRALLDMAL